MAIVTIKEINAKYTEVLSKYLAAGMSIEARTMSGSQGEMAHIDLTDGKNLYRIIMGTGSARDDSDKLCWSYETIEIEVRKYEIPAHINSMTTIWNSKGELIEHYVWFEIEPYRKENRVCVESIEEIKAIRDKKLEHYKNDRETKEVEIQLTPERQKKIADICRKRPGYKSIRTQGITKLIKKNGRYVITIDRKGTIRTISLSLQNN